MRIRVYADWANVETDQPLRYDPPSHAAHLLAMNRATIVGSRSIQLLPLPEAMTAAFISASGYDFAVAQNPARNIREVWRPRESWGFRVLQMIRRR